MTMTPNTLIDLMRSDPMAWLWDTQVQAELFALLGTLWKQASEAERNELVDLVLQGMPRDRFRSDMEPAEWDRMNARAVWERLARIERDGSRLPDPATARLAQIRERFPMWELTGEPKEDFATGRKPGTVIRRTSRLRPCTNTRPTTGTTSSTTSLRPASTTAKAASDNGKGW